LKSIFIAFKFQFKVNLL